MKRKVGKRKKQLQQKYFFRKLLLTEGILIIAAVIILGGVFLVKKIRENVNTVSMVEEASGLDMDDSNSLAAVKAAMARPAEFSPQIPTPSMPGSATQMWMESSPSAETISATLQPMAIHRLKMEKSRISGQQKPALLLTAMPPGPEAAGPDSLLWKNGPKKPNSP